jgi:YegS/Rv2252/BmrU family lipid kinase
MATKIKFIVNPIAGFRRNKQHIIERLQKLPGEFEVAIEKTTCRGDAKKIAAGAAVEGFDTVVAVGGDGTVNEVASGLVGTGTALGIVPIGSGNGLARSLGIPLNAERAIAVSISGQRRRIDAGCAAHRHFFVVAGVGFDATVGKLFDAISWRGPLPYFYLGIKELVTYQPQPLRLSFEEKKMELAPFLITVANTCQYGNGAMIAPQALYDDGQLDICVINEASKMAILRYLPNLFNGTIDRMPHIRYYRSNKIAIAGESPLLFHVDGEPDTVDGDLHISVLPQALRVIAPPACANSNQ